MISENEFERLENALFEAGRVFPYPSTPHLSVQVREALEAERARRQSFRRLNWNLPRWALTLAIAIVLAVAALLLNPDTRETIAQLLGLRTVRIVQVTPTPTSTGTPERLNTPVPTPTFGVAPVTQCCATTLELAQERASFKILVPPGERPSQVYFQDFSGFATNLQQVILVFGDPSAPRFTLYEAHNLVYEKYILTFAKEVQPSTVIDMTQVRGREARWLSGAPHIIMTLDANGRPIPRTERPVSANTLVWESGTEENAITYRLETTSSEQEAIRIAESLVEPGAPTPTPTVTSLSQCCETTLDDARRRARFKILLPPSPAPSRVYFQEVQDGQQLILVFGDPNAPRFTLYESTLVMYQKGINPGTFLEETQVKGARAVWLSGAEHVVVLLDASGERRIDTERVVNANTLAWEIGDVTYRIETTLSRDQAVQLAESLQ